MPIARPAAPVRLDAVELPGFTLPGDVSASDRFYARDIVREPIVLDDGHVRVPTAPGSGVEIDPVALEDATVARVELRR